MTEQDNNTENTEQNQPEFQPQTALDHIMVAGRRDPSAQNIPLQIIQGLLKEKRVFFLSPVAMSKIDADQKVQPLTLAGKNNQPVVAIYTHVLHVPQEYLALAPHPVGVPGGAVVASVRGGGIIINPGTEVAFEISAKGVEAIKKDFFGEGGAPAHD